MSTKPVVCVRDSALGAFLSPFVAPSIGTAQRQFGDEAGKSDSPIHAHPEDYELYHLADFDDVTGEFTAVDRRAIARGKDFTGG